MHCSFRSVSLLISLLFVLSSLPTPTLHKGTVVVDLMTFDTSYSSLYFCLYLPLPLSYTKGTLVVTEKHCVTTQKMFVEGQV